MTDMSFTHLNNAGHAYMVDVTAKQPTVREATAIGKVLCSPTVLQALKDGTVPKGDVLAVARISGIKPPSESQSFFRLRTRSAFTAWHWM